MTGVLGYAITVGGVFMYSEAKRRTKAPPNTMSGATSAASPLSSTTGISSQAGDATVVLSVNVSTPLRSKLDPNSGSGGGADAGFNSGSEGLGSGNKVKGGTYLNALFSRSQAVDVGQHRV